VQVGEELLGADYGPPDQVLLVIVWVVVSKECWSRKQACLKILWCAKDKRSLRLVGDRAIFGFLRVELMTEGHSIITSIIGPSRHPQSL
jgi:hypothetical protein